MSISYEIGLERRPFKSFEFIAADGVTRPQSVRANPNNRPRRPTKRDFKQLEFVADPSESEFITTRCYAPDGEELWTADHGSTVWALAVDEAGYIYQSGDFSTSNMGESLFHQPGDITLPLVTKLNPDGEPIWAFKIPPSGGAEANVSRGVCVAPSGAVYATVGVMSGNTDAYVAKLSGTTGNEILRLPTAGFDYLATPPVQRFGQVRCDSFGNVVAMGNRGIGTDSYAHKWVNDTEYWIFRNTNIDQRIDGGMNVTGDGEVVMGSHADSQLFVQVLVVAGPEISGVPNEGDGTVLAYITSEITTHHCFGIACSPGGRIFFKEFMNGGKVTELIVTDDPMNPARILHVNVSELQVQTVFEPKYQAIAVNDAGVYAYSRDRVYSSPVVSHEIRAANNSLILSADHGGQIWACAVLPDGKVIVAGDRVPKSEG